MSCVCVLCACTPAIHRTHSYDHSALFIPLQAAVESFARFGAVWKRYGMLPEVFYPKSGIGRSQDDYPLRPEFAESNYFLLKATGDR